MTLHHESLRDHACLIVHGPDKPGHRRRGHAR